MDRCDIDAVTTPSPPGVSHWSMVREMTRARTSAVRRHAGSPPDVPSHSPYAAHSTVRGRRGDKSARADVHGKVRIAAVVPSCTKHCARETRDRDRYHQALRVDWHILGRLKLRQPLRALVYLVIKR
jgi:hypothetical protein